MNRKKLSIGLLGCGVVGRGLMELVHRNGDAIRERTGIDLAVKSVLVRDPSKHSPFNGERITAQPNDVVRDDALDLIVEVMGGLEPARSLALAAIESGKHVVTANKLLLAESGSELFEAARLRARRIGFEASVCGGVPIIRALSQSLVGDRIESLVGIVNGTNNYVLHRMEEGRSFEAALGEAQARGFAEADPSMDIDGHDAAQKISVIARIAFGVDSAPSIVEGIRGMEPCDLAYASELGFAVRHIALASRDALRVHPALVPRHHPLASVRDESNAVLVKAEAAGELLFAGRGAGALPTASAVLSDVLDIACGGGMSLPAAVEAPPPSDFRSRAYLRVSCADVPGVVGLVATALENQGVAIAHAAKRQDLVLMTEPADESRLARAVDLIARLPVVRKKPMLVRVLS